MKINISKLIVSQKKNLLFLILILIFSLLFSSVLYSVIQKGDIIKIDYRAVKELSFYDLFIDLLLRNTLYFVIIFFIVLLGYKKMIYVLFSIVSIYWGLAIIHTVKILNFDKIYFILNMPNYFVYFPALVYYTLVSLCVFKNYKKNKIIETKYIKFDIITISYIKFSFIWFILVIIYSLLCSNYYNILFKMLVK